MMRAFLSGLALLAGIGAARAADAPVHLTIAQTSNSMGWAADYIALDKGFFREEGLDVEIQVMSGGDPQVVAALRTDGAQIGALTTTVALQAIAKGEKLQMLAPYTRQYVVQIVINPGSAEKAGIKPGMKLGEKFRHAKGMTVGVLDVGGGLDMIFRGIVKQEGLDVDRDFTETAIHSYPGLLSAAKRGQVDIALTAIPFGALGVRTEGLQMVTDIWNGDEPALDGAVHEGMFATAPYIAANPQVIAHLRAAIGRALALIHDQPQEAVAVLHKRYPAIPEDVLSALVVGGKGFPPDATVSRHGFDLVKSFVAAYLAPAAKDLTYEGVVLPAAQEKP